MNKNEFYDDNFHFDDIDKFCDSKLNDLLSKKNNQKNEKFIAKNIEENIEILEDSFFKENENIEILDIEIFEITNNNYTNEDEIEILDINFVTNKKNYEAIEILEFDDDRKIIEEIELLDDFSEQIFEKDINKFNLNEQILKIKRYRKKKIILIFLLILMLICLIWVIYKIVCWKLDNNSIDKQLENIRENVVIEEINNNENTVIVEVPSESLVENNANNSNDLNIPQEPIIDKNNDYWKFIDIPLINVDFTELINLNSDTIGWLQVNGTNINYPVVQTNNNAFYLNHSFDKKYNDAGWIFVDYRNNLVDDKNLIIYGHSRLNSTMFGTLKNVVKSSWYTNSDNHLIKLSTINTNTSWQVFSTYVIDEEGYYIQTNFNNENEYLDFLNTLKNRSIYNYGTSVNKNDRIITLSTCYINNQRVVLHAKLIKYENR